MLNKKYAVSRNNKKIIKFNFVVKYCDKRTLKMMNCKIKKKEKKLYF